MRAAIVFFASKHRDRYRSLAHKIAEGFVSQGNQADVIDGEQETDKRLTIYQYLVIGCEPSSLFGKKIPASVSRFLSQAGTVGGKRSCAFTAKHPLASSRALSQLMKVMEKEGLFLTYSEILTNPEQAESLGKRII